VSVHIIAEGGTNHGGDLATAKRLVDAAVAAGANSVKFQIINPEGLYLPRFWRGGQYEENPVFAQRAAAALSDDEYRDLAKYSRSRGIEFAATVFDSAGVALVDELDVPYIKTASCDLNNSRHLAECAQTGRRLVISTGMASLGEIERAVNDVVRTGNSDVVLLHCVSVYPCALEEMNLRFLQTLRAAFGLPVGLSDHTESSLASAVAVSMGAQWIEKHFTLDRSAAGFDHAYAMEPDGLDSFIDDMRGAELACASRRAKLGADECSVKSRARRGLFAAHDIAEGAVLTDTDILAVRPEGPLAPNDAHLVVGRRAAHAISQYEPLSLESVC
jgi:sialic acid synthase SpsE